MIMIEEVEKREQELHNKLKHAPDKISDEAIQAMKSKLGRALAYGEDCKSIRSEIAQAEGHNEDVSLMTPFMKEVNSDTQQQLNTLTKIKQALRRIANDEQEHKQGLALVHGNDVSRVELQHEAHIKQLNGNIESLCAKLGGEL